MAKELDEIILKFALKNAIDYGKANTSSVLGKVIPYAENEPIAELKAKVEEIVGKVNSMSNEERASVYSKYAEEFEAAEKRKEELSSGPHLEIEGAEYGKVATRFPPEPGGFIHIGNMKQCMLSEAIAKKYGGTISLYFDDTNPEKCSSKYVEAIKADTSWMGVHFAREYYASDFVDVIYEYGKKLIEQGLAYVCFCDQKLAKENRKNGIECMHRKQTPEENKELFSQMIAGKFADGEAVLRLKGNMQASNDVMRDPTLFRIKRALHYRQGSRYIVWPTYHMNTPIVDSINGITDVIKGKEYEKWGEVHEFILKSLNLPLYRVHYESRLRIAGNTTAKRVLRELIKKGYISGWDDPRLVTIAALRRRGIQPQAIREFVLRSGFSKYDGIASMDMLIAENTKIINPIAKHLFFVRNPVKVSIDISNFSTSMPVLPGSKEFRNETINKTIYISDIDASAIKEGDIIRLKGLKDAKVIEKNASEIIMKVVSSSSYSRIMQWVAASGLQCSVIIPKPLFGNSGNFNPESIEIAEGMVENYAAKLKLHDIVQFERFGYCILDSQEKGLQFILISGFF
ncbi:MAG: glutamate--tRNA ligase [Candidatus Micrarchaeaceae archaeon]